MAPELQFVIIFGLCAVICILFLFWNIERIQKGNKERARKQFEIDLKAFNATGLERKSIFDIKINEDIRKKAIAKKEAEQGGSKRAYYNKELYVIDCINVDICPVCGEAVEEISCPKKPGCWDILVKCTKCNWQLILADLSYD